MSGLAMSMLILAIVSFSLLWWVYDGYLRLLNQLPMHLTGGTRVDTPTSVTVLITAWNEADVINARIQNVLSVMPERTDVRILVASDGSTDGTDAIVEECPDARVSLHRCDHNVGKTATQNAALDAIDSEIVIFTDAASTFERGFLQAMLEPFQHPNVGLVDATLQFKQGSDAVGSGQSRYWRYEQAVRRAETRAGIQAVASGAGLAIRRSLIRPMRTDVGEDCLLPLQVIEQGFRIVHASDAIVTDRMPESTGGELKARARMTARNWIGTWSHARLLNPFRHPMIAAGLWSHKVLRWLSPIVLFVLILSTTALGGQGGTWLWMLAVPCAIVVGSSVGGIAACAGIRLPLAGSAWAFTLANVGFAMGLWQVVRGHHTTAYRNMQD